MIRPAVAVAAPVLLAATGPSLAGQNENVAPNAPLRAKCTNASSYRLMIINGNSGRVTYDDRRDDMVCVTLHYFVGRDYYRRHL